MKKEINPIFADIGAFVGHYSCYVSKFLKYEKPIYALESNKEFCNDIKKWFENECNCEVLKIIESPITGPKGNKEFLLTARCL